MTSNTKQKKGKVTRDEFIANQKKHCESIGFPFFMPYDGICWRCGRDIVERGIELGKDGSEDVILGCPFCARSYDD